MDKLKSLQTSFSNMILAAESSQNLSEIIDYLYKAMLDIKKIHLTLNITSCEFDIVNKNVVDTLLRFKNNANLPSDVKYSFAQLFDILFSFGYIQYICNEPEIIVDFITNTLALLNYVKRAEIYHILLRKVHLYMNHIYEKQESLRSKLLDIYKSYPIYRSKTYKMFPKLYKQYNIEALCKSDKTADKELGIYNLVQIINNAFLPEQFELIHLCAPDIIYNLFNITNTEEYDNVYKKLGNLLCTLLYPSKFKISFKTKTIIENMNNPDLLDNKKDDKDNDNYDIYNLTYVLNDKAIDSLKDIKFLDEATYELSIQKQILQMNPHIVEICIQYINNVIKRNNIFPLQFIVYSMCRRIYFFFPEYRNYINNYIIEVLNNLSKFKGQFEWNTSLESREFAFYLLANDKVIGSSIKSATAAAPYDIQYESIFIKQPNMTIGFNYSADIEAGTAFERILEIFDKNSLIYISISMPERDGEIDLCFCKYDSNIKNWIPIFMRENMEFKSGAHKVIVFAKEPGIYKIIFDNQKAWLSSRRIYYRFVYLSPIN